MELINIETIDNTIIRFPLDKDLTIFLFTKDMRYFLYDLKNEEIDNSSLFTEVSYDTYADIKKALAEKYNYEPTEIVADNYDMLQAMVRFAKLKSYTDNQTLEERLGLC